MTSLQPHDDAGAHGVSIDLRTETVLTLRDAASKLPRRRGGKRPHIATLYRWTQRGCRGVRLETIQVGGSRCTSLEALQRFFNRLTILAGPDKSASFTSPSQQNRERNLARKALQDGGFYR